MKRSTLTGTAFGLLLMASSAWAATTGKLSGTVTDAQGGALPGVTITASSPAQIGGARVTTTGADGTYSFPALAPGAYEVKAELDGFAPQQVNEVAVRLDGTTQLDVQLSSGEVSESIIVTSEAPVVDPEQVSSGQTFTQEYLENAALGSNNRSYQSVLNQTGGVAGGSNPNVFGSTLGENAFLIDGIDTTDPVTSTFGTNFNFDAIQEISFATGGFEAEYGRATGGVVNVITKSGGNNFSGTVDVRYTGDSFTESGDHFDPDSQENKSLIPGATLGGPIMRDKLWFFLADEYTKTELLQTGEAATQKFVANYVLGKLTWQINPSWQGVAKYSADPADIDNAGITVNETAEAATFQEQGGDIVQAELSGVLTSSLLWDIKAANQAQSLNSFDQVGDLGPISHFDDATGVTSVSSGNAQFSDRDRQELKSSLTYFVDGAGSHEFKAGIEYGALDFSSKNYTPTGFSFYDRAGAPRLLFVSQDNPPFTEVAGTLQTAFLQDSWQITPRVTAKLGVRYDQATFDNNENTEIADLSKIQPRLGLAWDVAGNGKSLARLSWGTYMHPSATTLPSFVRTDLTPTDRYLSCTRFAGSFLGVSPAQCRAEAGSDWLADPEGGWDPNGWFYFDTLSGTPNLVDPNLDPTYAEELIVAFEQQLADRTSISLTLVDKTTKDIFEDTCDTNLPTPDPDGECHTFVAANLPELARDYRGAILTLESRATSWLHLRGSYTWSKSEGSVEYTQNAGADFDFFPDHYSNAYGYLADDRRHRLKLNGFFVLPKDIIVGVDAFWSSKFAYDHIQTPAIGYGVEYLEPRGSRRANTNYQLDVELKKGFQFGNVRAEVIASVFNLLDTERTTLVCERTTCAGGRQLGDATQFQIPRNYELGLRFEF